MYKIINCFITKIILYRIIKLKTNSFLALKKVQNSDFNIFGNMTMTKKDMTMTLTPSAVWPDLNDLKIDTCKVNSLKKYLFIKLKSFFLLSIFYIGKIFFLILVSYSFSKFLSKIQFLSKIHSVPSISRPVALFLFINFFLRPLLKNFYKKIRISIKKFKIFNFFV